MDLKQMQETPSSFRTDDEYVIRRDEFTQYIEEHVNPAREQSGLRHIGIAEAQACFRILDKFFVHWRRNGICD